MFDVAVIGAGMAGLTCAQQLFQAGYSVVVAEKSRGVGGRVATRRLHGTCADHGTRYLEPKGHLQQLIEVLSDRQVLQVWTDTYKQLPEQSQLQPSTHPLYIAPAGMSAVAKFLAAGLEIWLKRRVQAIALTEDNRWRLTLESVSPDAVNAITAGAVVFAIPAPQALSLLEPLASRLPTFVHNLRSVEFDPCFSVIAGYASSSHPKPIWKAVTLLDDSDLAWIGWDSSKRQVEALVFVVQSSSDFAKLHLEQDLDPVGYQLLHAAQRLLPWLDQPDWMQVHRWRYAFASRPWHETYLSAGTDPPLICCGDWCGGDDVESSVSSGLAAATEVNIRLQHRVLPELNFRSLAEYGA